MCFESYSLWKFNSEDEFFFPGVILWISWTTSYVSIINSQVMSGKFRLVLVLLNVTEDVKLITV